MLRDLLESNPESKEHRGENFFFLGQLGQIFLSGYFWVVYVCKSRNVKSTVNINNLLSNKYPNTLKYLIYREVLINM